MALDDWFEGKSYRTFSITIAAPGVISSAAHGLKTSDKVILTTSGALPTGISVDTFYFIIEGTYADGTTDPDTFKLATSLANSQAGTAITTSGSQSGAHYYAPAKPTRMAAGYQDNR